MYHHNMLCSTHSYHEALMHMDQHFHNGKRGGGAGTYQGCLPAHRLRSQCHSVEKYFFGLD